MAHARQRLFGKASCLLRRARSTRAGSLADPVFPGGTGQLASSEMSFLGAGFGDRFEAFRGGSGLFEEGVYQAEEPVELQGKRGSERCSHVA
jgi:hypothetical protein